MYACIALLTNDEIQNIGRKMVYDLSAQYGINTISARLPQHISMKQSFQIKDLVEIEGYVEELASDLSPFEVEITGVELVLMQNNKSKNQILWFRVEECPELRELHNRLNVELMNKANITMKGFDGGSWKFHSSISYGIDNELEFKEYFESIVDKGMSRRFMVDRIAIFYSPDSELEFISENFTVYKVIKIKGLYEEID